MPRLWPFTWWRRRRARKRLLTAEIDPHVVAPEPIEVKAAKRYIAADDARIRRARQGPRR